MFGHFRSFGKIMLKTPLHKSVSMEKKTKLRSSTPPVFLPLIDSPTGLPKLKFVESTVFEITGGSGSATPPSLLKVQVGLYRGTFLTHPVKLPETF